MEFLAEIKPNIQFQVEENAPPQIEMDLFGKPSASPLNYYQLFLGNAIYLFGTIRNKQLVYAITQVS